MEAQPLVQRGVRWKIASGEEISVWRDPWLNYDRNFLVQTPHIPEVESLRVSELMIPEARAWNRELVEAIFDEEDIVKILRTPIAPPGSEDMLIWHFNRDGRYSVKSGYRLAASIAFDRTLEVEGDWKNLWNPQVPSKVKDCAWRICRDVLPHKVNLRVKNIVDNSNCVLCDLPMENSWHLFFDCYYAKECWTHMNLWNMVDEAMYVVESAAKLMLRLLRSSKGRIVAMVAWQVWKERNSQYWNGSHRSSWAACRAAEIKLEQLEKVQVAGNGAPKRVVCRAWHPPERGMLKINVDAAFFYQEFETGLGMVLRDENGTFVQGRTVVVPGRVDEDIGEAMGFLEALSWANGARKGCCGG